RMLDRSGLEITTTLDSELQEAAVETARRNVPAGENEGIGSSIVTVQQNTGNIKTMAQNTEYEVGEGLENGETTLNFNVDKDWGGGQGFQLGSTLKPFVAMAWIGSGKSMRDTVDASRDNYTGARFPAYCLPGGQARIGGKWEPMN